MDKRVNRHTGKRLLARLRSRFEEIRARENASENLNALGLLFDELEAFLDIIEHGEREWQDALDAVQDPIFLHDEHYRILRANLSYARQSGMAVQQVIGKHYWEVFPKGKEPLAHCACLLGNKDENCPSEEIILDGGRTFLSRGFAVKDARGNYLYSVHIMEDVTEKRHLQQALEVNAVRYRSLFEGAPDAIFLADANTGQLFDANPAAEIMTGRSQAELITLHQSELHPPGAPAVEVFNDHVKAGFAGRVSPPTEIPVLRADGEEVPTEINARVFQLNGKPVIQGIFRDVSVRKRAEEKLREATNKLSLSHHLLERIIESVPIRVFWKDKDLRYLGCNSLFARDAGYSSPEALINKTDFDTGWKEQAERYREDDQRVM